MNLMTESLMNLFLENNIIFWNQKVVSLAIILPVLLSNVEFIEPLDIPPFKNIESVIPVEFW